MPINPFQQMKKVSCFQQFLLTLACCLCFSYAGLAQKNILIVVTNNQEVKRVTDSGKDTVVAGGFELSEVSQAHYVFTSCGYQVDFMSPLGGLAVAEPNHEPDAYSLDFLANTTVQKQLKNTLAPAEVDASAYRAIYFAGGKTMWDFPDNKALATLTANIYEQGGIVGAVCHGPAALVNVKLSDGSYLIDGKKVSSFSNVEEKVLSSTTKFLPYLLEDKLKERGAIYKEAPALLEQVVEDQRVVTGQNPMSTFGVAETMMRLLGEEPKAREWSKLELTLDIIKTIVLEDYDLAIARHNAQGSSDYLDQRILKGYTLYSQKGYLGALNQKKSIDLLKFTINAYPEDVSLYEPLAKAYQKIGHQKLAIQTIKKGLKMNPDAENLTKLLASFDRK